MSKLTERIDDLTWYHVNANSGKLVEGANGMTDVPLYKAEDIYSVIKDLDVEAVVRCKDCKHTDLFYPYCTIWEAAIDGDGYCYKGEKE